MLSVLGRLCMRIPGLYYIWALYFIRYIKLMTGEFNFLLSLLVVALTIFMMLFFKAKEEFRV